MWVRPLWFCVYTEQCTCTNRHVYVGSLHTHTSITYCIVCVRLVMLYMVAASQCRLYTWENAMVWYVSNDVIDACIYM